MPSNPTHFLWCDLETTGLEPFKGDKLLEFAFKLTDLELTTLWSYEKVIHFSRSEAAALKTSCQFVYDMHTVNGLLDECAASDVTCEQVEIEVVDFLKNGLARFGITKSDCVIIAGSSIHFDRKWLEWYAPEISEALHYRIMDVSSLYPVLDMLSIKHIPRPKEHRAMKDVERSIGELSDILKLLRKDVSTGYQGNHD